MKIAVIGAGTYGSYVINALLNKYPQMDITLFDVGNKNIKTEREIGYYSSLKNALYKGLTNGRLFGFGGASVRWGGQLLTFTENDFCNPDGFMKDVIKYDKQYKDSMLAKFNIENKFPETHVSAELFTKTGVWLSALHHDFFKWFKISKRKQVKIRQCNRVVRLEAKDGKHIDGELHLFQTEDGDAHRQHSRMILSQEADKTGSEHHRLQWPVCDHLSQKVFKVKKSTIIGSEDFVFRMRGTSLITKRMIGEVDGCSFYVHPVFNLKFPFFESVKEVLFKRHFEWKYIWNIFTDLPHVVGFAWSVLVLRKMYVMNNEWFLYIDIENPTKASFVELSKEKDKFGLPGLDVHYFADSEAEKIYEKAKIIARRHLDACGVDYELLAEKIDVQTCEDIYHPYGMFLFDSAEDYFNHWDNMLLITTGCLSRSGGINPTASMLPMVDEFINNHFKYA